MPSDRSAASPSAELVIRVTPRAARARVGPWTDGVLSVSVTAAPVGGAATRAALRAVADHLDRPPSAIRLLSGARARTKRAMVAGLSHGELEARLELLR